MDTQMIQHLMMTACQDEDNDKEADVVQQQYDANDILTGNVHNNSDTFDEEAMCKFMDELRVAECPTCGLFRYPDDPKHIDICHLHVYCTVCNRFEGAYFGVDRCDGFPTMDETLLQPIPNTINQD